MQRGPIDFVTVTGRKRMILGHGLYRTLRGRLGLIERHVWFLMSTRRTDGGWCRGQAGTTAKIVTGRRGRT